MRNLSIIGATALLLCGCDQQENVAQSTEKEAVPAILSTVGTADGFRTINIAGTVRLRRETALGFTTNGQVASVRYDEGDRVRRGAVLAALDNSVVSANLEAANAENERAASELARIEALFEQGWVTRARLDAARAAARSARAAVGSNAFASRTSHIHAPSNGIILQRNIDPGQIVAAGATVMVMGEVDKGFVLRVPVSGNLADRMHIGMPAQVEIGALGKEPILAKISEMDGRADAATGTFDISFLLPSNTRLRSGQLGKLIMELPSDNQDALTIPAAAVFDVRAGEGLVYVVDAKNRARQRNVVLGEITNDRLEILEGLQAGEKIVSRGIEKIQNGDLLKVISDGK